MRRSRRYVVIKPDGARAYYWDARAAHQEAREAVKMFGVPVYVFVQIAKWSMAFKRSAQ